MNPLLTGLALQGTKTLIDLGVNWLKNASSGAQIDEGSLRTNMEQAVFDAVQWSSSVQVFGMSGPRNLEDDTVPLRFGLPRHLNADPETIGERELLFKTGPCVILGAPGAGKTTTVKRLVRLAVFSEESQETPALLPWVLRFREFKSSETVLTRIADLLGIPWTLEGDSHQQRSSYRYKSGKMLLVDILAPMMEAARSCLFLDGLDELIQSSVDNVLDEIKELGRKLSAGRVIVTTRTGHFSYNLEGFWVFQIQPIGPSQINQIISWWSTYKSEFTAAIQEVPYRDLTDRPLFLIQLILIHNQNRTLPDQPSRVYKQVTRLLLQEWDRQNRTLRPTRYTHFEPERKAEFLSAIAYELTFLPSRKTFSTEDLEEAYSRIYRQFGLPVGEARRVAEEIETHTGIIQASGAYSFEFSHFSLQEYLAAEYLVRSPYPENLPKYLSDYPAVLSIAVALSSDPAEWLASLILPSQNRSRLGLSGLTAFVERLRIEGPRFRETPFLGGAAWLLEENLGTSAEWFIADRTVETAMAHVLAYYVVEPLEVRDGRIRLMRVASPSSTHNLELPEFMMVSAKRLASIAKAHNVPLGYLSAEDRRFARYGESSPLQFLFDLADS